MFVLVCYDVPDDERRTRIFKRMKGFGVPVQKSVFECLLDEGQFARMEETLRKLAKTSEDLIRCYRLCESCRPKTVVIGEGKVLDNEAGIVV